MSKTFSLARTVFRLGLAGSMDEACALIRFGMVRVDGDTAPSGSFVGYGVTVSVPGIGDRVVSRQALGVR